MLTCFKKNCCRNLEFQKLEIGKNFACYIEPSVHALYAHINMACLHVEFAKNERKTVAQ